MSEFTETSRNGKPITFDFGMIGGVDYLIAFKQELEGPVRERCRQVLGAEAKQLNRSLKRFFEFLRRLNIDGGQLSSVSHLTLPLLGTFKADVLSCQDGRAPTTKAKDVNALFYLLKNHAGVSYSIVPSVGTFASIPHEPYAPTVVDQLVRFLHKEVSKIYRRQQWVESCRREGTVLTMTGADYVPNYSLENVCHFFRYERKEERFHSVLDKKGYNKFNNFLRQSTDNRLTGLTVGTFVDRYHAEGWRKLADCGRPPAPVRSLHNEQFLLRDVVATLLEHPEKATSVNSKNIGVKANSVTSRNIGVEGKGLTHPLEVIVDRLRQKNQKHSDPIVFLDDSGKPWEGGWDDLKAMCYPTLDECAVIYLFATLQTGWNPSTVACVDPDNLEHPMSAAVDGNSAVLTSSKKKAQNKAGAYSETVKEISGISNRADKYSALQLLKLMRQRTQILRDAKLHPVVHGEDRLDNPLFCYVGFQPPNYFRPSFQISKNMHSLVARAKITQPDGTLLKKLDLNRLRPTWHEHHAAQGVDRQLLTLLMGHNSETTTDMHYDNHSLARRRRQKGLHKALKAVVKTLDSEHFKGLVPTSPKQCTKDTLLAQGHVFTDTLERMVCVCLDSKNPTWPGAEILIAEERQCTALTKCLQCTQCMVTASSLPYIIDRHNHLSEQKAKLSPLEFTKLYGNEYKAAADVIDGWPDPEQIDAARRTAAVDAPLLPADLQIPLLEIDHD